MARWSLDCIVAEVEQESSSAIIQFSNNCKQLQVCLDLITEFKVVVACQML